MFHYKKRRGTDRLAAIPLEHDEQQSLFQWAEAFERSYPELRWLYAIPNQGVARLRNLQTEGAKRGVPDIHLPAARSGYHSLYIELQRKKGSKIAPEQYEWLAVLDGLGHRTAVAYGWDEAREIIIAYLEGRL